MKYLAYICAMGVYSAATSGAFAQGKVTITGGPGSVSPGETVVVAPPVPVDSASDERIRQIVREELQRAGVLPPLGTGPYFVNPNPSAPPATGVVASLTGVTNRLVGSVVASNAVARFRVTNTVGIVTPNAVGTVPAATAPDVPATGAAGQGGTAGVISGGSRGVGVATPSGAGANRSATVPPTGAAGTGRSVSGR